MRGLVWLSIVQFAAGLSLAPAEASNYVRTKSQTTGCYDLGDYTKLNKLYGRGERATATQVLADLVARRKCISLPSDTLLYIQLTGFDGGLCVRVVGDFRCVWIGQESIR